MKIKKLWCKYSALIIAAVMIFLSYFMVFALGTEVGGRAKVKKTPDITYTTLSTENIEISESETSAEAVEKYIKLDVTATAYCPCEKCCGKSNGITATGVKATAGRTIAVDPSVIPYGTEVIINGHTYIAEDCGGAVKNNKVDIFFNTHEEALNFGRQQLTAFVCDKSLH